MREKFIDKSFRPESLARIAVADAIVEQYMAAGLRLTLRQLYYQFVAHHGLPNTERSYKNLASLVSDARLAGLLDWDAIEDRGRVPDQPTEFSGMPELMNAALRSYRLPRWAGQETYAELWVEKQALAGVLSPLAREFHVTLMVNKGYSSSSAMYEAANRFNDKMNTSNRVLFYLGDHDPSGEDMVRDIADRLYLFNAEVDVRKLALTMDQIREHNPPPNPAKISDARFATYSAKHGNQSWEVDALDPATLAELVREAFNGVIDVEKMDAVKRKEERDKGRLKKLIAETKWSKA